MKLEEALYWKEPRIILNTSHPYWKIKQPLKLQGQFLEDCLWYPAMYYSGVDQINGF